MTPGPAATAGPAATPTWTPSPAELADLELLLGGVFAPLTGYLSAAAAATVTGAGRLDDGTPWRADVALHAPADVAAAAATAGTLVLTDPEGTPLARLSDVEATGRADRIRLAGRLAQLTPPAFGPFRRLVRRPAEVPWRGRPHVVGALVDGPLPTADLARLRMRSAGADAVALLVLTGPGSPRGLDPAGLVRATRAAAARLTGARWGGAGSADHPAAEVVAVPYARRADAAGEAFLRGRIAVAYGLTEVVELPTVPVETVVAALDAGDPTAAAAFPGDVAAVLSAAHPPPARRGVCVFFTGLSGSGKSTLARALADLLTERGDRTVSLLDGDVVRRLLSAGLGFSRADREANIARIGYVAAEVARHGGLAICAPIAPYAPSRAVARGLVTAAGGAFVLVHVATPLAECERRDRKGLYAKARAGLIPEFTGVSDPYEEPADAELVVDTTGRSVPGVLADVVGYLDTHGWTRPAGSGR